MIDKALAAAVGDDAALVAELRAAFREAARDALAAIDAARDAVAWRTACARLRGLAASFDAPRLAEAAARAGQGAAGDAAAMRPLRRLVARL